MINVDLIIFILVPLIIKTIIDHVCDFCFFMLISAITFGLFYDFLTAG